MPAVSDAGDVAREKRPVLLTAQASRKRGQRMANDNEGVSRCGVGAHANTGEGQRDQAGDLGNLNGKGSQCKDRVMSCRVLAQSTKSPQNSKRQESMNTETDISPVNPSQENNFNPCLRLGLKFA